MHDLKHKQRGNRTTDFAQNNKCQKGKDNQGKCSKKQGKSNKRKVTEMKYSKENITGLKRKTKNKTEQGSNKKKQK